MREENEKNENATQSYSREAVRLYKCNEIYSEKMKIKNKKIYLFCFCYFSAAWHNLS